VYDYTLVTATSTVVLELPKPPSKTFLYIAG